MVAAGVWHTSRLYHHPRLGALQAGSQVKRGRKRSQQADPQQQRQFKKNSALRGDSVLSNPSFAPLPTVSVTPGTQPRYARGISSSAPQS
ncbi:MAG: hypothetical protein BRC43_09165 [Cyanobacteria bacterium QS_3_48_167]|nr:MAG: hypothetical protein BRC43_09165 [Cyanobacteria bacterium QS_3_48_167]